MMTADLPAALDEIEPVVFRLIRGDGYAAIAAHLEPQAKALHVVRLSRRRDDAEWSAMSIAARVAICREATARSAKPWAV